MKGLTHLAVILPAVLNILNFPKMPRWHLVSERIKTCFKHVYAKTCLRCIFYSTVTAGLHTLYKYNLAVKGCLMIFSSICFMKIVLNDNLCKILYIPL